MGKQVQLTREQIRVSIWTLRNSGLSWNKIAKQVGKNRNNVRRIYKRVKFTGECTDQPRTGRPRKLNDRDARKVIDILRKSPAKTAEAVRKQANKDYNLQVSTSTIQRTFKRQGYVARVKRKKPLLTKQHRKRRLDWAKKHSTWTVDDWKRVIWSDETAFTLVYSEGRVLLDKEWGYLR